jgi:hypothetical protein
MSVEKKLAAVTKEVGANISLVSYKYFGAGLK